MDVTRIPLSSPERIELRKLFTDNRYDALKTCLQAECDILAWEAKVDITDHLWQEDFDPSVIEGFKKASRLAIALEVLREYESEEKELFTLRAEP
jgi:hypothetical protein